MGTGDLFALKGWSSAARRDPRVRRRELLPSTSEEDA
jgi:hypothetical protein